MRFTASRYGLSLVNQLVGSVETFMTAQLFNGVLPSLRWGLFTANSAQAGVCFLSLLEQGWVGAE